jgi:hypothetical protein
LDFGARDLGTLVLFLQQPGRGIGNLQAVRTGCRPSDRFKSEI